MKIATLSTANITQYKKMMLDAYENSLHAFTSTRGERENEGEAWWEDRIEENKKGFVVGAFSGDTLIGSVAIEYQAKKKLKHKAHLVGMYVNADVRSSGVGRELLKYALDKIQKNTDIQIVVLTVTKGNDSAVQLYRAAGFRTFGVEPMAIYSENEYFSKEQMFLEIKREKPNRVAGGI